MILTQGKQPTRFKSRPTEIFMLDPQNIAYLVVHCSDTADDAALTGRDIHQMHLGFGWDGGDNLSGVVE